MHVLKVRFKSYKRKKLICRRFHISYCHFWRFFCSKIFLILKKSIKNDSSLPRVCSYFSIASFHYLTYRDNAVSMQWDNSQLLFLAIEYLFFKAPGNHSAKAANRGHYRIIVGQDLALWRWLIKVTRLHGHRKCVSFTVIKEWKSNSGGKILGFHLNFHLNAMQMIFLLLKVWLSQQ